MVWLNRGRVGCTKVAYDGFVLSDVFEVRDINAPLLPPIEAQMIEIAEKPGAYFVSRKIRTRDVIITLALDAQSRCPVDINEEWAKFVPKFLKNTPRKLEIGSRGYLWAMLTGETNIELEAYKGVIEMTFTCFDPFYYGEQHEVALKTGNNNVFVYGNASAYPTFELSGINGTCTIKNNSTADQLRVAGLTSTTTLRAYMEEHYCTVNGSYREADLTVSDFWPLEPGDNVINLSAGTGKLTYQERSL